MDTRDSLHFSEEFAPARRVHGMCRLPGDKSISHRALLLSALAEGATQISGLGTGQDVRATAAALVDLGVPLQLDGTDATVRGLAPRNWRSPELPIDCGNSGTTLRLLTGLLAAAPGLRAVLAGDASLAIRPMRRVVEPLRAMGADIQTSPAGTAPITVHGQRLHGLAHELAISSAQLKTALLLAGLCADGETSVREPQPSRDHTERMLLAFGAELVRDGTLTRLTGRGPDACPLTSPGRLHVPGDPSSAAFPLVAALLHADGLVRAEAISGNPTRLGFVRVLQRMGARLAFEPTATEAGEPVGTLIARSSSLHGVDVAADDVPACIDELPILALCAAAATGTSRFHGVAELRVKESDRLAATICLLGELGVRAEAVADTLIVQGLGRAAFAELAAPFDPGHDHRMAMTAAVAGMVGPHPVRVRGFATVASSFPEFGALMRSLAQ